MDAPSDDPGDGQRTRLALERTRLANERTFLAYARTGMALLAAGAGCSTFSADGWRSRAA